MQEKPTIDQICKLPFFFILGRPRSGTTLLRTLLDVHPNVLIPLENSGMIHLYFKYRNLSQWDTEHLKELLSDFFELNSVKNWNIDREGIKSLCDNTSSRKLLFHEIIQLLYFNYQSEFAKEEIRCMGDKSPINSLYSAKLSQVFPNARFIHLVRDYRANLASMSKHDIFSPSLTAMLMQWKKSVNQIHQLAEIFPHRFLLVKYEDLVSNPEGTYETICKFLNIKYSPELLDPDVRKGAIQNLYSSSFISQWQPDLSGKISTSHIEKWKVELSAGAVRKADYIAGKTGQRLNYEPITHRFGLAFILITEFKKLLFHLNEMNRYLYDRLPYRLKIRIRNRNFILSFGLIHFYQKNFGKR